MKKGTKVYTQRFCTVTIDKVFENADEARKAGFVETTYTTVDNYAIKGRSIDCYHTEFAAVRI